MNSIIPFQDLKDTVGPLADEYIAAATEVIRSGRYINSDKVKEFERQLAASCGASYAVSTSTGLDALRLILSAYMELGRLKPGDEVIVPANTFIATFLAVSACGLQPVAADVDKIDLNLDLSNLPLTEKTKAVIPVHLYGTPCWDSDVFDQLHGRGILVIEDNAQAIGAAASQDGFHGSRLTGNLGDAAAISFYPAKNIGALGDAGAVLTSDPSLAHTVRKLANYGSTEKYHHELLGFNCRMDAIQAAMLSVTLGRLDEITERRRRNALLYDGAIENPDIMKPAIHSDSRQVWHQYVIRHPRRDELRSYLAANGTATEIHYPVPAHLQPCYTSGRGKDTLKTPVPLTETETAAGRILSLPIANVSEPQILKISELLNSFA